MTKQEMLQKAKSFRKEVVSNSIKIAYVIHMMQLKGIANEFSSIEELCRHIGRKIHVNTYDCTTVIDTLAERK